MNPKMSAQRLFTVGLGEALIVGLPATSHEHSVVRHVGTIASSLVGEFVAVTAGLLARTLPVVGLRRQGLAPRPGVPLGELLPVISRTWVQRAVVPVDLDCPSWAAFVDHSEVPTIHIPHAELAELDETVAHGDLPEGLVVGTPIAAWPRVEGAVASVDLFGFAALMRDRQVRLVHRADPEVTDLDVAVAKGDLLGLPDLPVPGPPGALAGVQSAVGAEDLGRLPVLV